MSFSDFKNTAEVQQRYNISYCAAFLCLLLLCTGNSFGQKDKTPGRVNFERGRRYEKAAQWDKASDEFLLALAAQPAKEAYQKHYLQAINNLNAPLWQRGQEAFKQGNFALAYQLWRQAFANNPLDDCILSASEKACCLIIGRCLKDRIEVPTCPPVVSPDAVAKVAMPTGRAIMSCAEIGGPCRQGLVDKLALKNYQFSQVSLAVTLHKLADDLGLKVILSSELANSNRLLDLELKNVTSSQVVDYTLLQEGLVFLPLKNCTILIFPQSVREKYRLFSLTSTY